MHSTASLIDVIITLFCLVDDALALLPKEKKTGRPSSLSSAEILTFALLPHMLFFSNKKACYRFLRSCCRDFFPSFPAYQNFVQLTNQASDQSLSLLLLFCNLHRQNHDSSLSIIDSTPLPVCKNKRIHSHKVCDGFAKRSKTTTGWFYGFKLHITCDEHGRLLSIAFTQGNVDDRTPVSSLSKNLTGILLADAGYVSEPLRKKLWTHGLHLFAAVRNNMQKLMTSAQHTLLRKRQRVETVFSVLKERLGLVSSLSRSLLGHFARYIHTCLAYCFQPLLNQKLELLGVS